MSSLLNVLSSRRLSMVMLGVLALLSGVGALIPQENFLSPQAFQLWKDQFPRFSAIAGVLGLTRLFTGYLFTSTWGMLFLSLTVCTVRRLSLLRAGQPVIGMKEKSCRLEAGGTTEETAEVVRAFFRGKGYREPQKGDPLRWKMERGRWGILGSLLFHFSFLLLMAGVFLSIWGRFEGNFLLTEGQTFRGEASRFLYQSRGPLSGGWPQGLLFHFRSLEENGSAETLRSSVFLRSEEDATEGPVRPHHPLVWQGNTFHQEDVGVSPRLILRNDQGEVLLEAFMALRSEEPGKYQAFRDFVSLPGSGLRIEGRFLRDGGPQEGTPQLEVVLTGPGEERQGASLVPGEEAQVGGLRISFPEWRRWSAFRVVRDPGLPLLFGGFLLGAGGLLLRILRTYEEVAVECRREGEKTVVLLHGSSDMFPALFAERFQERVSNLSTLLAGVKFDVH